MDFEDLLAADDVGVRHDHLPIEPAGPQQSRIEHVRAVGRSDQNHPFVRLETIHLDEQLVQGLLAFVVAPTQTGAAVAPDRIDLVDEDDARRILLALLEHVAHPAGTNADKHLDKVRTGDREERHIRFAGNGASEQGLAGARRADQQHPLGYLAAEALKLLRVLEIFNDLFELLLGLVDPGYVLEGDAADLFGQQPRPALAEAHGSPAASIRQSRGALETRRSAPRTATGRCRRPGLRLCAPPCRSVG